MHWRAFANVLAYFRRDNNTESTLAGNSAIFKVFITFIMSYVKMVSPRTNRAVAKRLKKGRLPMISC